MADEPHHHELTELPPEPIIDLAWQIYDHFCETHGYPERFTYGAFGDWATETYCPDHFDAIAEATGLPSICGLFAIIDATSDGETGDDDA